MRLRIALAVALSLALSGISILCCYVFGTHLAPEWEGQLYGMLGSVADALKALLPFAIAGAIAARQKARTVAAAALFIVFSLYSFTSELGLYALGRNAVTSDIQASKEEYERDKAERVHIADRLKELGPQRPVGAVEADIAVAKKSLHWQRSESCERPSGSAERELCGKFERLKGELASAQEADRLRTQDSVLSTKLSGVNLAAVLRSTDPQSEALARFTGFSPQSIRDALAVFVAVLIELGSGLGLWAATAGISGAANSMPEAPQAPAPRMEADPVPMIEAPAIKEAAPPALPAFEETPEPEKPTPRTFPPRRPRLIASEAAPFGSVAEILGEALETAARGKLELAPVFRAYSDACRAQGKRPVSQDRFVDDLTAFCRDAGIAMTGDDAGIYLRKVRLKKSGKSANA
jgi:hypothetical protein